jgi:hypothetical protein
MEVIVLAVTRAFGRYCIAGKTLDGRWIRPIPPQPIFHLEENRFWLEDQIVFNGKLLKIGDKIYLEGYRPNNLFYLNHSEDFISTNMEKIGHLDPVELIDFLDIYSDDYTTFTNTVNAGCGRSLCVIEVDDFIPQVNYYNGRQRITMRFQHSIYDINNPRTNNGAYVVKDCRWEELLSNDRNPGLQHNRLFFCVGLATPYNGIEYPMAIGIITDYEIPALIQQ